MTTSVIVSGGAVVGRYVGQGLWMAATRLCIVVVTDDGGGVHKLAKLGEDTI